MKKYVVRLLQEDLIDVEVEADDKEGAITQALNGVYDFWEIVHTKHRNICAVEEVEEQ